MRPEQTTVLLFCVLLLSFAVLFLLLPQSPFSNAEKRALQTRPRFSLSTFFSGRFGSDVNRWYADQFPFRGVLVGLKSTVEIALGKGESHGILLGRAGQLARAEYDVGLPVLTDRIDEARLQRAAAGVNRAARNAAVPTVFLFPGRTVEIASSAFGYPVPRAEDVFRAALDPTVNAPSVSSVLRKRYENGDAVVYRTDHHWTVAGAYEGYCEVLRAFGMEEEIIPLSDYSLTVLTDSFRGTFAASGGIPWVPGESLTVPTRSDDDAFRVTADGVLQSGFYTRPQKDRPIGYDLLLDGTHDVVTVEKPGEDRPRLVVFKDSFANSMAPFLARHFDLVLLNLSSTRKDFTDLTALAGTFAADRVLVVYSVANLATAGVAPRFR